MRTQILALLAAALLTSPASAQKEHLAELHRPYPSDFSSSEELDAGDVDGDGDVDVIISALGIIRFYRNVPGVRFCDETQLSMQGAVNEAALADVDGDGDLDVVSARTGPDALFLYDGVEFVEVPFLAGNMGTVSVESADVDGDGDPDLLRTGTLDELLLNDGSGTFVDGSAGLPEGCIYRGTFGDLDGDGDADYLQRCAVLLNDGAGTFSAMPLPPLLLDRAPALGDVDGDGDLDAYWSRASGDALLLNDGAANFADASGQLPALDEETLQIRLADIDGDGDLDAATAGGDDTDRIVLNDGSGVFTVSPEDVDGGFITSSLLLEDLDGDGDVDLILASNSEVLPGGVSFAEGKQDRLLLNDGTGSFTDVTAPFAIDEVANFAVELVDLNSDGDLDVFAASRGENYVYVNDGFGRFVATPSPVESTTSSYDAAAADLDGDGDFDLAVADEWSHLLFGDGAGGLTKAPLTGLQGQVATGDVDGDGDADLYFGSSFNSVLTTDDALFVNDGAGGFTDVSDTALPGLQNRLSVELVDVDSDGDLDVLAVGSSATLQLNDGGGGFSDDSALLPPVSFPWSARAADLSGDGLLDLYFGDPGPDELFLATGPLTYVDATDQLPPSTFASRETELFDLEGDGDLDVINVSYEYPYAELLLNDGAGFFSKGQPDLNPPADDPRQIAIGDIDGDGDPDAVIATHSTFPDIFGGGGVIVDPDPDVVLTNLTRQLVAPDFPGIGKTAYFDVHGSVGAAWTLAFSTGAGSLDVAPFGTLKLAPLGLLVVTGGTLGADGVETVPAPVPAQPALVGNTVYFQALVGTPLRFTNAERVTITAL
ncbi:MAG: VCBS repeat-containing protein [Planctomycetota bacterium]